MKIMQLVTRRQHRGAEVFSSELSYMLGKRGHQIYFVGLYSPGGNILEAGLSENIDLDGKKWFVDPFLLGRLISLIRKKRPEIIHANGSDTLKYAVLATLFAPGPKVIYRNISMVSAWVGKSAIKKAINRFLFAKVDGVSSVGRESLNDLLTTYDYPSKKGRIISRGIPSLAYDSKEERRKLAREFNFPETDNLLVHVGRFSPEKNHSFLVNCFKRLTERERDIRLLFIGEGENMELVKSLVCEKQLENHIFFAGHRNEVQRVLAGCDLFILGSTIEGVPGVVLEAGMQEIPAVAIETGGVSEVVLDQQTGILIKGHDEVKFSEAIADLINDPQKRKMFGLNAKRFVREKFSLEKCTENFEEFFSNFIDQQVKKQ